MPLCCAQCFEPLARQLTERTAQDKATRLQGRNLFMHQPINDRAWSLCTQAWPSWSHTHTQGLCTAHYSVGTVCRVMLCKTQCMLHLYKGATRHPCLHLRGTLHTPRGSCRSSAVHIRGVAAVFRSTSGFSPSCTDTTPAMGVLPIPRHRLLVAC